MAVSHQLKILRKSLHATWLERMGWKIQVQDLDDNNNNNFPNIISNSEDDDWDNNQVAGAGIAAPEELLMLWLNICRLSEMAWQLDSGPQIW